MPRLRGQPEKKSVWCPEYMLGMLSEKHATKIWTYLIMHPEIKSIEQIPPDKWVLWSFKENVRATLLSDFVMNTSVVVDILESSRGDTTKLLIELFDGHRIETVIMKHSKRTTVCVSSQVGCNMGCRFCATGTMGIIGDLRASEIIEQLVYADRISAVRNVVFMGMGEPLNNYDNLRLALNFMIDPRIFSLSARHVTVSTVGVTKNMRRLADEFPQVNLAVSLHAPNQILRKRIIPTAGGNPIDAILTAITYHIEKNCHQCHSDTQWHDSMSAAATAAAADITNFHSQQELSLPNTVEEIISMRYDTSCKLNLSDTGLDSDGQSPDQVLIKRRLGHQGVMIEYILIAGLNDQPEHAHELGALLRPLSHAILLNLIPYNPTDVKETFEAPTKEAVTCFQSICMSGPYWVHTRIRQEMGQDIAGACGQLALKNAPDKGMIVMETNSDAEVQIEEATSFSRGAQRNGKSVTATRDYRGRTVPAYCSQTGRIDSTTVHHSTGTKQPIDESTSALSMSTSDTPTNIASVWSWLFPTNNVKTIVNLSSLTCFSVTNVALCVSIGTGLTILSLQLARSSIQRHN